MAAAMPRGGRESAWLVIVGPDPMLPSIVGNANEGWIKGPKRGEKIEKKALADPIASTWLLIARTIPCRPGQEIDPEVLLLRLLNRRCKP
jgi:hypothetical protein